MYNIWSCVGCMGALGVYFGSKGVWTKAGHGWATCWYKIAGSSLKDVVW